MLERLRARARTRAWDTLVAAILLQRDAGGDLPALLRELASALEAGDRLERDARAATAQARFTAWLVVALPVGAAALAELAAPGFLRALVAAPLPAALTALAFVLQATGLVAIHRIVRPPRAMIDPSGRRVVARIVRPPPREAVGRGRDQPGLDRGVGRS